MMLNKLKSFLRDDDYFLRLFFGSMGLLALISGGVYFVVLLLASNGVLK